MYIILKLEAAQCILYLKADGRCPHIEEVGDGGGDFLQRSKEELNRQKQVFHTICIQYPR